MSLSNALSNAVSGLSAIARGTELVSSNLSNALTPGYARRDIQLSAQIYGGNGGGVRVDGVQRSISASVLSATRLAFAGVGANEAMSSFALRMEQAFGVPGQSASLSDRLSQFDQALTEAASRPDSDARLANVLSGAKNLVATINSVANQVNEARSEADANIASEIGTLNRSLAQIATLNRQIVSHLAINKDASALMDQRQQLIDGISDIIPIKEVPREHGRVALFTAGGVSLLDGSEPAEIGFTASGYVSPYMKVEDGNLGELSIDGVPLTGRLVSMFEGGSLAAQFDIRDRFAPQALAMIDAFAHEVYARFSDPAVDPTLVSGVPGLFTDNGTAFNAPDETGLASRLKLNGLADPSEGGALWRLRDGIAAGSAGPTGSATLLSALSQALNKTQPAASSALPPSPRDLFGIARELMSQRSVFRVSAEAQQASDQATYDSFKTSLLAEGVDTDQEMEKLLALEKAYAANAKVVQTASQMLDDILRI